MPMIMILQTYLGVAIQQENRDAVALLLKYGSIPYPSIEVLLCYFKFGDTMLEILDRVGESPQLDEWNKGMLQLGILSYNSQQMEYLINRLLNQGYTKKELGLSLQIT